MGETLIIPDPGLVDQAMTANYRRPAIEVAAKYSELGLAR